MFISVQYFTLYYNSNATDWLYSNLWSFIILGWRCGSDQSGAAQTGSGQESGYGNSQRGHGGGIDVEDILHFVLYIIFLSTKLYSLINKKIKKLWCKIPEIHGKTFICFMQHTRSVTHTVFTALTLSQDRNITCLLVIWQAAQTHCVLWKCTSGGPHDCGSRTDGGTCQRVHQSLGIYWPGHSALHKMSSEI